MQRVPSPPYIYSANVFLSIASGRQCLASVGDRGESYRRHRFSFFSNIRITLVYDQTNYRLRVICFLELSVIRF